MSKAWRLFIPIEAILLLAAIFQFISRIELFVLLIIGSILIYFWLIRRQRHPKGFFTRVFGFFGGLMVIIALISNYFIWLMLITAVVLMLLSPTSWQQTFKKHFPWSKKQFISVDAKVFNGPDLKIKRQRWLGDQQIGENLFTWEDMNLSVLAGDTIIDLGSTILPPNQRNTIVFTKGFGKTRILVPVGTGVCLLHKTYHGKVTFMAEKLQLNNEQLKIFSPNFEEQSRQLTIISNLIVGDIEVIMV